LPQQLWHNVNMRLGPSTPWLIFQRIPFQIGLQKVNISFQGFRIRFQSKIETLTVLGGSKPPPVLSW